MKNSTKKTITDLATFVLTDEEYKKVMSYINLNLFNNARLLVEEKRNLLEATLVLYTEDEEVLSQIKKLNNLEDIFIEEYINSI